MIFSNRRDAGCRLALRLEAYKGQNAIVLALPRGGVPVGYEVAGMLQAPLDVLVVRKLGAPGQPELAIGAIGPNHTVVLSEDLMRLLDVSQAHLTAIIKQETAELERRLVRFRGQRPFPELGGRVVIIIDDGLATGATARAAVQAVRKMGAGRIVLAVPVCARDSIAALQHEVDDFICLETPADFQAVSSWYQDFDQTTDSEVVALLEHLEDRSVLPES